MRIAVTGFLLLLVAAISGIATRRYDLFVPHGAGALAVTTMLSWALAIAAFLLLRRVPTRPAVVLLFAGSLLIGGAALAGPPNMSSDSARYAWDGIVQDAGISPYAYTPASDALAPLRPEWLFPEPALGADGVPHCAGQPIQEATTDPGGQILCTAINRPKVPTIYPPVAEMWFAAVRALVPRSAPYWPLQVAGLLVSLAVTGVLFLGMRARGMDPRWATVWGWSPFVAAEAVNNAHVDALGVLVILAATFLAAPAGGAVRRVRPSVRPWLVGLLVGLAAAVKGVPAIVAPPLLRRGPVRVVLAAAATFAVVYVPYVIASGWSVLGFLPGYLAEEGYDSGSRFALVGLVVHGTAATITAGVLLLLAAGVAVLRADPREPWHAQTVLAGTVLLIVSPAFPWYALTLIPFIALSRRWEWLAVPLALSAFPFLPQFRVIRIAVAVAVVVVISAAVVRGLVARRHASVRHSEGEPR